MIARTYLRGHEAELDALAGVTSAANKVPYFTGSGTAAVADFTAYGRSLAAAADASAARTLLAFGSPSPAASQGLSAWAFDPAVINSSTTLTGGTIYLVKLAGVPADTVTKIYWAVATAGATATAGQNWVGLYDSAGTRLQQTGVDADAGSGTGLKTTTITGQLLTPGAFYWAAFLFNASTVPTLARMATGNGGPAAANAGTTAATMRFATAGTSQTTLPSSITPASNVAAAFGTWCAVGT
jgi:hypothetical protein